jgi:uncharacterized protein (DUF4415 family)
MGGVTMTKKSKKINYGRVDTIDGDLDIKKSKIRITTMIDYPIYEALKDIAEDQGEKYQTLLNKILKDYVKSVKKSAPQLDGQDSLIEEMNKQLKDMAKRVERIEKKSKSA